MEQLPKIVQRSLQASRKPGVHPDPDQLAAFAEKSLTEPERVRVLQHLAECADCRDVISLALPEAEAAPSPRPEGSRWLTWPMLRWGALAACAVVVSAAVTLHYESGHDEGRQTAELPAAKKAPAAAPDLRLQSQLSQKPEQKLTAKIQPPSAPQSGRDDREVGKFAQRGQKNADAEMTAGVSPAAGTALDEDKKLQSANNGLANFDALKSANKPAKSPGEMAAAAPAPEPGAQPQSSGSGARSKIRNDGAEYSPRAGTQSVMVDSGTAPAADAGQPAEEKAKDETRANELHKQAQVAGGAASAGSLRDRKTDVLSSETTAQTAPVEYARRSRAGGNKVAQWTLSADGKLERSLDSGKTWQTVPVASNVVFRALAANDADIWLGGAAGVLYHSSDAGQHWNQVTPAQDGKVLTGDIVTVEFSDARRGKLVSGNGETWTTSDAGATWQYH
ncbi:MAG: YCF48-related protein [Terriglobales bacterium]